MVWTVSMPIRTEGIADHHSYGWHHSPLYLYRLTTSSSTDTWYGHKDCMDYLLISTRPPTSGSVVLVQ